MARAQLSRSGKDQKSPPGSRRMRRLQGVLFLPSSCLAMRGGLSVPLLSEGWRFYPLPRSKRRPATCLLGIYLVEAQTGI